MRLLGSAAGSAGRRGRARSISADAAGQHAEPAEDIPALDSRPRVRQHSARAQAEERDGNGKKREMVVENDGKDARQRQFENQRRERGERDADVNLRPVQAPT